MVLAPLLIDLSILLTCLGAFALCLLAILIVRGLFGTLRGAVGWIPYVGRIVSAPIHQIEQKLIDVLSRAAVGTQHRVGAAFHSLEHLTIQIGESIAGAVELAYAVAVVVSTLPTWAHVKALYDSLAGRERATVTTVREHSQAIPRTARVAKHAARTADVAKVRAQAVPLDVLLPGDLAGIRARTRAVEDAVGRLWHRVRGFSTTAVGGVALGALAYALAKLGMTWARCSKVNRLGRNACRMDESLITDLIEDSLLIVGGFSLIEFAEVMGDLVSEATVAINDFAR